MRTDTTAPRASPVDPVARVCEGECFRMPTSDRRARALRCIRDHLAKNGRVPSVRELAACLGYSSPRSAAVVIEDLVASGHLAKRPDGKIRLVAQKSESGTPTTRVPVLGSAPCG